MSRLVMKFGGTSMATPDRIRRAASIIAAEAAAGKSLAVVVSAMAGKTNELVAWSDVLGAAARGASASDDEYDVVVASGEQVTSGLLAIALRNMGLRARSWLGWQIPILTDDSHGKARIVDIPGERLGAAVDAGEIAIIPGFQGVTADGRLTTLGRGGSDTSAVAVAAALGAPCDIYTDVDGVYTTDPRIERKARRLPRIAYEEMLEFASLGAKVMQSRSIELAMAYHVPVRVLSSFAEEPPAEGQGTLICEEDETVEQRIVSGVALSRDEAKVTLLGASCSGAVAAEIFSRLAEARLNVDMIIQSPAMTEGATNILFTVGRRDAATAETLMRDAQAVIGFKDIRVDTDVVKVSVIGVGMRSHAGVAGTMFQALADAGITVQAIATSEIKISVLVETARGEEAVRLLHAAYGLEAA
jgi:aspartate kinase